MGLEMWLELCKLTYHTCYWRETPAACVNRSVTNDPNLPLSAIMTHQESHGVKIDIIFLKLYQKVYKFIF